MINFKKIGAELIITVIISPFIIWTVSSIYSLEAETKVLNEKSLSIISIEQKIDYIYQYLIDHKEKK